MLILILEDIPSTSHIGNLFLTDTHTHTHTHTQRARCPEDTPIISHLIWCWKRCHMFDWTLYLHSLNSKWLG